jgi:peptide/nickel transport system substrate-binding protein
VTIQPPTEPYAVQMNTEIPPFNNKKAREALYYASDWQSIDDGILHGRYAVVQGIETPGDLFYHKTTPGYRTYDLAKAKQLVSELGGLKFSILLPARNASQQIMTALQSQWQKAGMTVQTKPVELGPLIQNFKSGKWNAALQPMGGWDPGAGTGVQFRFGSNSPYSGVHDKRMDELIDQGLATSDPAKRDRVYQQINKYLSDNAYVTFGFGQETAMVAAKGVHAPGLTTKVPGVGGVIWAEAWRDDG